MKKDEQKILLYGLGALAIYIIILRPILIKFGLQKDPLREQTEERKKQQIDAQIEISSKEEKPTKTIQQWQVIADAIYNDLRYSSLDDNKEDAGYQVTRVQNDADFWTLFKVFGKRQEYFFGINAGSLKDLQQFITSNLKQSKIDAINKNYASKKMKFRF
jgi:hypothetical protein